MLSNRARYALRAILELSLDETARPVLVQDIADRQAIPLKFLQQILLDLKQSGILTSRKGPGGGYRLAKPPASISLWDIVSGIEGASLSFTCTGRECGCPDIKGCVISSALTAADEEVRRSLDETSVADIRERHREKSARAAELLDFSI